MLKNYIPLWFIGLLAASCSGPDSIIDDPKVSGVADDEILACQRTVPYKVEQAAAGRLETVVVRDPNPRAEFRRVCDQDCIDAQIERRIIIQNCLGKSD